MGKETNHLYEFGPFRLDSAKRLLFRNNQPVTLTSKVFDTLLLLVRNRERVVEKDEFMKALWPNSFVEEANLAQNVSTLRRALGESPNEHRYIVTMPERGYRFVGTVTEPPEDLGEIIVERHTRSQVTIEADESVSGVEGVKTLSAPGLGPGADVVSVPAGWASPAVMGPTAPRGWRRNSGLTIFAVFLLLAGGAALMVHYRITRHPAQPANSLAVRSIAVLPFKSLADGGDDYLGLGLADALITKLTNIREIVVRPTSAVLMYSGPKQSPLAAGRELGVDGLLEGTLQRSGERIRLTLQLVRVSDGRALWAGSFDDDFTNVLKVEDSISAQVAATLALKLAGDERKQLARHGTENVEAYQDYLRGRYYAFRYTAEGFHQSIRYFDQAIERDPVYALAYAGLSDSYLTASEWTLPPKEAIPKAKTAAQKAVAFDDTLGEAHASLAHADLHDWDFSGAQKEFARSLDLNPNNPTTHLLYSEYLIANGQLEKATTELETARRIDPLSLEINAFLSWSAYLARHYDEAITSCRKGLEMDPNFWMPHYGLGDTYEEKGMYTEAVAELQKADTLDHNPMTLAEMDTPTPSPAIAKRP